MSVVDDVYPPRAAKPRSVGLTVVLDTFQGLNPTEFRALGDYVDIVSIAWGLPLLVNRTSLVDRVRFYHDLGIKVLAEGALLEIALARKSVQKVVHFLRQAGFDIVNISDGASDLNITQKEELVQMVSRQGLDYLVKVGRNDQKKQLTLQETIARIHEAFQLKSKKVILEGGEEGRWTGIYDELGRIRWSWLNEIAGTFGPPNLIFEAPLDIQQVSIIQEFGPDVNIGGVLLNGISRLESRRRQLLGEATWASRPRQPLASSPAAKFIYHLVNEEPSLDQSQLMERSGLPKRTVQAALEYLKREGFIREVVDVSDSRKRKYSVIAR